MIIQTALTTPDLAGIFETDTAGNVIYHRPAEGSAFGKTKPDLTGFNLFEEMEIFANAGDFQRRFKSFVATSQSSDCFDFGLSFQERILELRVKLVRVREREENENRLSIIVDIRKA